VKPVISFTVTAEQAAEAQDYAVRKGYGRASNLARVAMIQLMARYPKTTRGRSDDREHGEGVEGQRGVRPDATSGNPEGGIA
jgi:hypothetical protein